MARGALYRRYPGVYSFGPGELSREAQWMAAVLATGGGAVLSHLSAAELWAITRIRAPVPHVLAPRRHRPIKGLVLHSYRALDPRDVTVHRGIPVTSMARIFVDLSDVLTKYQLTNVIKEAAFRKRFDVVKTRAAMARANGRRNLDVLTEAIDLYLNGSAGTKSGNEDAFLTLLQFADVPDPLMNTVQEGEEVDCCWPDRMLVVEVDGPGHERPSQKREDARRDKALRAAGYTVLRFTDVEIEHRPADVLARLLRCFQPLGL